MESPVQFLNSRYALADTLRGQRRQDIDIVFGDKARARIDVQTGEAVLLGQADLEDGHVALQPYLLVIHETDPAILDTLDRRGAQVETSGVNFASFLASG